MKKSQVFIIWIISVVLLQGCFPDKDIKTIVNDFQNRFVADTREEVFDITAQRVGGHTYILEGDVEDASKKNALIDLLRNEGFKIQDSISVLPTDVPFSFGQIVLSVANLRAKPSHRAEMVSQALMGTPVRILKDLGSWFYVQTPDRYLSWCEKAAIEGMDDSDLKAWRQSERVMIKKPYSFVVDKNTGQNISDVVAGCILLKEDENAGRVGVILPDGRNGFLPDSDITPFHEDSISVVPDSDRLAEVALQMLGIPYLWGGTSVKGMDCSGFTKTIYLLNGLILARDASLQARHGVEIDAGKGWGHFETGDLLFFAPKPESKRITHVGLYLSDSEFIHSAGRVKINSLDSTKANYSSYRDHTLISVRRISGGEKFPGIMPVVRHPWY